MAEERKQNDIELWTIEEFAEYLRVTIGAARAMIRRGQAPAGAVLRIGKRIRVRSAIVRGWVAKCAA